MFFIISKQQKGDAIYDDTIAVMMQKSQRIVMYIKKLFLSLGFAEREEEEKVEDA